MLARHEEYCSAGVAEVVALDRGVFGAAHARNSGSPSPGAPTVPGRHAIGQPGGIQTLYEAYVEGVGDERVGVEKARCYLSGACLSKAVKPWGGLRPLRLLPGGCDHKRLPACLQLPRRSEVRRRGGPGPGRSPSPAAARGALLARRPRL